MRIRTICGALANVEADAIASLTLTAQAVPGQPAGLGNAHFAPSTGTPYRGTIKVAPPPPGETNLLAAIRRATLEALRVAESQHLRKLAVGSVALAQGGPRPREIARAMLGVIMGFQEDSIEEIILVSSDEALVKAFESELF